MNGLGVSVLMASVNLKISISQKSGGFCASSMTVMRKTKARIIRLVRQSTLFYRNGGFNEPTTSVRKRLVYETLESIKSSLLP